MTLQAILNSKLNLLLSRISIRIIGSKTISYPDHIGNRDCVDKNKSLYLFYFNLFPTQKWCQKWDTNSISSGILLPFSLHLFDLFARNFHNVNIKYLHTLLLNSHVLFISYSPNYISYTIYLSYYIYVNKKTHIYHFQVYIESEKLFRDFRTICHLIKPKPLSPPLPVDVHFKFFKIMDDSKSYTFLLDTNLSILQTKTFISTVTLYSNDDFYLCTRSKYLNDTFRLALFDIPNSIIYINHRIKGGGDVLDTDGDVSATSQPNNPQRPFFLDRDNSPNTWLLLLEFSFTHCRYNSITKAQHLTAYLPTELLQSLGPKIINIMNSEKLKCDYFAEICELVRDHYKPSETDLFDKYFRTQSLGLLTPSQFLAKACSDLELLHPGSSSNLSILRRSFLAVLPPTARAILAGSEKSSLEDLASIADKVLINLPDTPISHIDSSVVNLIKTLSEQVASLQLEVSSQRRSRSPSDKRLPNNRDRSKSASRIICSNHFKFKHNSTICCIGCTWSNKRNCTITQICVYHDVFSSSAQRCLPGCTFQKN